MLSVEKQTEEGSLEIGWGAEGTTKLDNCLEFRELNEAVELLK